MKKVALRGSDLTVSRLGFGTASMHHLARTIDRQRMLLQSYECGLTHFDTSPLYGYGVAERELGRAFRDKRDNITIATKFGLYPPGWTPGIVGVWGRKIIGKLVPGLNSVRCDWSLVAAERSLEASLRRLQTDYIDLYLVHEPAFGSLEADSLLEWLQIQLERGRIRCWGMAGKTEAMKKLCLTGHGLSKVIQTEDSLYCRLSSWFDDSQQSPQLTYGYFRTGSGKSPVCASEVLAGAFRRNPSGAILVSTRSRQRLAELAQIASQAEPS